MIDRIVASKPINKQAAIITGKGFEYTPRKQIQTKDSETPLPIRRLSRSERSNTENLTGRKFGNLTVLGKYRDGPGWVVRCACGVYTVRQKKAITNPKNNEDCCEVCRHTQFLKRSSRMENYKCWCRKDTP